MFFLNSRSKNPGLTLWHQWTKRRLGSQGDEKAVNSLSPAELKALGHFYYYLETPQRDCCSS